MAQQPLTRKNFRPGDVIFRHGEIGNNAYLVQKGLVEIVRKRGEDETVLRQVRAGEIFGAMAAVEPQPRIASARAVEESICVVIPRPVFEQKIAASDPLIVTLLHYFISQLRGAALH